MISKIFKSLFPKRNIPVVRPEPITMYATIHEVSQLTGTRYSPHKLIEYCTANNLVVPTVSRKCNIAVNSYPDIAWKNVYDISLNQLKLI